MTSKHTPPRPVQFKPKALVIALRRALPFLVAFSLATALVSPAAGRSGENAAAFTATQLIRQFTLKNTVAQVSQGMQGYVQEVNGFLRAPAMGVRPSGFPNDMGSVPATVNLPRRDGAGRPLGYCAWDNASASSDANHLAGSGVSNPLAYAVISPGLNGTMETTCANVLATGTGQGDDFVQVTAPAQSSSKQFRSAVGTVVELQATPAEEGDVRLVAENNKLYSYLGGNWIPVDGSKFADDSVANGAGALAYIAGKVTVADFQAASATITGALAADSATFTNGVTAATFTGSGSGLTDLNAGNISSGVVGAAFGGTGVDGSAAAQGSLLIGTGAGFALGAITAGDGIGVLNGAGSITISNTGVLSITGTADQIIASGSNGDVVLSLPQGIATTSTPTFAGMMLNGALTAPSATFSGAIAAARLDVGTSAGVTYRNTIVGIGAMAGTQSGYGSNVAVGSSALNANTTGFENTALGDLTLRSNTSGGYNTAVGGSALRFNTTGFSNVAMGNSALRNNITGWENIAIGQDALYTNTAGAGNLAFGYESLKFLNSGSSNIGIGYDALENLQVGSRNTAIGNEAGERDGTRTLSFGSDNTFLGAYTGPAAGVNTLNFGTAIGAYAEVSTNNTIVLGRTTDTTVIGATGDDGSGNRLQVTGNARVSGTFSAGALQTERMNIGSYAGGVTHTNIGIGYSTLSAAQSGNGGNLAVGHQVLQNNTTGHYNTGLGIYALSANQTGARNTAVGYSALVANTTGSRNSVVGYRALYSNLTGDYNVAMGYYAMQFSTGGSYNVVLGNFGLGHNTTGHSNSLLGDSAMFNNSTGFENVAVGRYALYNNGGGEGNVAVGYNSTSGLSSGSENTILGRFSMDGLTTGSRNVALGAEAGSRDAARMLTSGSDNTFLGAYTGPAAGVNTLNFATAIGAYAEVSTNNTIVLGRTTDTTVIGATGVASSGVLLGKKLQVTGDVGITGNIAVGGTFTAASATFTGALAAARLDVGTSVGVTYRNTIVGIGALDEVQTGSGGNVAMGSLTMTNNTTGWDNVAVGDQALWVNTTGYSNTAVGDRVLMANTTGYHNVGVGKFAMSDNTTGFYNVAVGIEALYSNITGSGNSAVGKSALWELDSGSENTAMGQFALYDLVTGSRNVALGSEAGSRDAARTLTSGSDNTFLGAYSGPASGVSTLNFGTAVGAYAQVGTDNTVVLGRTSHTTVIGATGTASSGALSGNKLQVTGSIGSTGNLVLAQSGTGSTLSSRILFGADFEQTDTISLGRINSSVNNSILQLTLGDDPVQDFGGEGDRFQIATTDGNVRHVFDSNGSAYHAGTLTVSRLRVGNYDGGVSDINFAIGYEALAAAQSGDGGNMAIGEHTLEYNSTGAANTALGNYAMHWNETGSQNTAVGYNALQDNVSGSSNTAMGRHVMFYNTTGSSNTAVGDDALAFNTAGNLNVAVGRYALYSNGTTGIGFENTAVGYDAMERLTNGAENTALGSFALNFLTTGSRNTVIGSEAASRDPGFYLTSGSDNSFLGAYSGPASGFNTLNFATAIGAYAQVSTNNTVVLGRTTDTVVIGATGNDASGNKLQVTGSVKATAFNTSSDRRLKNSITQLDSSNLLAQLQQLNAYHYRFNSDPTGQIRYGVIAQEVATLFPHAVSYDGQGLMAVDYGALGAIAATAVGQLSTQVSAIDKQVKINTESITTLTSRMGTAEGKIDALESWKTQAVGRMDNLQTAIDKNIADIAKNAVAITANTQRIDTLEEVTALLDARTSEYGSLIAVLQAQWSDTFSRADNGQTLVVNAPNLKASNFTAQQASIGTLYSERLMAEMAKIRALEVDSLLVNSAQARTVRAEEVNTGSAQVYAGVGLPALLFAASGDGHYTVNTSALDGSYATATVIVNAGQAKIVPVASEGIELIAEGNTVKAIAAGKSIKASWIKMG